MSRTPSDDSFPVGARIRSLRQGLALSQRELARRAGVTNANLSMIEQDKVSPALFTLEKILNAMEVDLAGFFASSETPKPVHKEVEFDIIKRKGGMFKVMPARVGDVAVRYLARATIYGHGNIEGLWLRGEGVVSGIVLGGGLVLVLDGEDHTLQTGDGFEFFLNRKHGFRNETAESVTMVVSIEGKP